MDAALFKTHFPEFAGVDDGKILFWSTLAERMVRQCAWGDVWPYGVELFTAHTLQLALGNNRGPVGGAGGGVGTSRGAVTSMSVDKVSVGFDANVGADDDAGYWNLTDYGKLYYRFVNIVGAGGRQL